MTGKRGRKDAAAQPRAEPERALLSTLHAYRIDLGQFSPEEKLRGLEELVSRLQQQLQSRGGVGAQVGRPTICVAVALLACPESTAAALARRICPRLEKKGNRVREAAARIATRSHLWQGPAAAEVACKIADGERRSSALAGASCEARGQPPLADVADGERRSSAPAGASCEACGQPPLADAAYWDVSAGDLGNCATCAACHLPRVPQSFAAVCDMALELHGPRRPVSRTQPQTEPVRPPPASPPTRPPFHTAGRAARHAEPDRLDRVPEARVARRARAARREARPRLDAVAWGRRAVRAAGARHAGLRGRRRALGVARQRQGRAAHGPRRPEAARGARRVIL